MASREEIIEDIAALQGWVDGEDVQVYREMDERWLDVYKDQEIYPMSYLYRIKPKPRSVTYDPETDTFSSFGIDRLRKESGRIVFREVLDNE